MQKIGKPEKVRRAHKLVLSREHLTSMSRSRELREEDLDRVQGVGSCYTDVRISQCCPDA